MKHMIGKSHNGLTKGKLCMTNLTAFYDKVICSADVEETEALQSRQVECVASGEMADRMNPEGGGKHFLSEMATSDEWGPQGSILVSMLFSIFISDLHDGIKSTLTKSDDETKLSGQVDTLEKRTILNEDLDRLEE
ncbi:hypothetical protein BTVI_15669 [Pitangus sulphuratus]|nr:hypothetical protein BTVI_15669 [Pitangus sulphuratus]